MKDREQGVYTANGPCRRGVRNLRSTSRLSRGSTAYALPLQHPIMTSATRTRYLVVSYAALRSLAGGLVLLMVVITK